MIGDFSATVGQYCCVFFFVSARTPALDEAEAFCRRNRTPFPEFFSDNPISAAEVRDFCTANGAFCYCRDIDAAVYISRNLAAVRALHSGTHTHYSSAGTTASCTSVQGRRDYLLRPDHDGA